MYKFITSAVSASPAACCMNIQFFSPSDHFERKDIIMAIITISRGSYSRGREVAEKLAERLNYDCISRDILIEASEHFNTPEIKLIRAIHDAPSILDRFSHGKERYIAYVREALLEHAEKDNLVYHGLAGHFFLQGIPHVLKIRITADLEERVKNEAARKNISLDNARGVLVEDDEERRKWALALYGIDPWDSRIYDLTIHIGCLTIDDAVKLILEAVKLPCFHKTKESQALLKDKLLSARVKAIVPTENVRVVSGKVSVTIHAPIFYEETVVKEVKAKICGIEGVNEVEVNLVPN
jgi:cytidylate kinase